MFLLIVDSDYERFIRLNVRKNLQYVVDNYFTAIPRNAFVQASGLSYRSREKLLKVWTEDYLFCPGRTAEEQEAVEDRLHDEIVDGLVDGAEANDNERVERRRNGEENYIRDKVTVHKNVMEGFIKNPLHPVNQEARNALHFAATSAGFDFAEDVPDIPEQDADYDITSREDASVNECK